ncbi:SWIM zinc finger family protein [Streptomyces sp. NPDC059668]|uniref:SWIM zinc finger family protein n=1 Tax=Streptomyces sp. NPDC059668 TaxID=3346900 RepID=UPI0036A1BB65
MSAADATSGSSPEPAAPGDPSALRRSTTTDATAPAGQVGPVPGAPRPGDVARQALRAARGEARQARTDAASEAAESRRRFTDRTPPTGSAARRTPRVHDQGARIRDVRDLLAGAFELPDADPRPRTTRPPGPDPAPPPGVRTAAPAAPPETPDAETRSRRTTRPETPREHAAGADPSDLAEGMEGMETTGSTGRDTETGGTTAEGTVTAGSTELPRATPGRTRTAAGTAGPGGVDSVVSGERSASRAGALPRSMASPGRDGELRRTFSTLPARTPDAEPLFARTWWGNAWVGALEKGALDAARLARGRAYADRGRVDAITVTPGLVLAYVQGSRPRPYRVQVALRTLDDGDWDRFLDAAAERPGHIAALLDKEMPRSLADCGVDLLPGPGDLEPHCSCPDSGHPCKHAAALCYETARLLDEDPFVLLLLRGRGERELLDGLSRRNAARAARAAQEQEPAPLPGVRARDAVARRTLPPLPAPLPAPAHPEQPPTYPGAPGGPDPFALDQLATDAAARAHALLTAGRDPVAELTLWQDAVRLAAARPGSGLTAATRALYSSLASAAGRTPADLARAVAAWRQGGIEGLSVLEEPWDPPAGRFDRARPLLLAADLPAFRPWRNHLTHPRGHAQLRLGHDGLWYAYESEPGQDDWWPRGTPDLDPVGALTGLGAPGEF